MKVSNNDSVGSFSFNLIGVVDDIFFLHMFHQAPICIYCVRTYFNSVICQGRSSVGVWFGYVCKVVQHGFKVFDSIYKYGRWPRDIWCISVGAGMWSLVYSGAGFIGFGY